MPVHELLESARAILLDADDTAIDTIGTQWPKHIHIAWKHYGKVLTPEEIRRYYGKPLGEYVCALYGTTNEEQAVAYSMQYRGQFPKKLFPFTIPALRCLREAGLLLGVVTTSTRAGFDDDCRTLGLPAGLLDYTQTADESPYLKPDPRVFDPAKDWLEQRGIQPAEACYVGDSLDDGRAALGARLGRFVGVETGLVDAAQFRSAGMLSVPHLGHLVGVTD
ncbi:MAG TPA: HAD hydrolase-like protein [Candidatus Saccharimonadales bacterium]|nr:HAD hydrolase-like protein [Candidatus Saccharimonadales bacterium]